MISHPLQCVFVRCSRAVGGSRLAPWMAAAITGLALGAGDSAEAQVLTPSNVFMSSYGNSSINNGTGVAVNRANAFAILTNGIVDRANLDRVNTFNLDSTGVTLDFVGLEYATPSQFDFIQIELGRQFGDGGDWEAMPNVYILKDLSMLGDTVEPNMSPNWVQLPSLSIVETTGHTFTPMNVAGPGGTIRFDLTSIPAADRTGWGWAVGGVDGNHAGSGLYNFTNFTEAFAEGLDNQAAPAAPAPTGMTPVNVVSNVYHSVGRNNDDLFNDRGQAFAAVTNGVVDHPGANDGFDTYEGDGGGTLTDFSGLIYNGMSRFDTLTVDLANQFGDGGDWDSEPRIFILKNRVDTNNTRPEDDPGNWREITGAVETTSHSFSPLVTPGPGGTISFDLTGIPEEERRGFGWAIGGIDGNANAEGVINFISVTELDATGLFIPGPYDLGLEVSSSGEVRIVNDTQFDLEIDFYEISSVGEALDRAGWNSLGDGVANPGTHNPSEFPVGTGLGDGWEELGSSGGGDGDYNNDGTVDARDYVVWRDQMSDDPNAYAVWSDNFGGSGGGDDNSIVNEAYLQGGSVLAAGQFISLGNLYAGPEQDLQFMYRLAGGAFVNGEVDYVGSFGSLAAVPEPGTLALASVLALGGLLLGRQRLRLAD